MVDEAFLLEGFHVPQTRSLEQYATPDISPLRGPFHKRILLTWCRTVASALVAGSGGPGTS